MTTTPATDRIETLVEDVMMLASDYRDARQGSEHRMTQSQLEKAIRSLIVAAPRAPAPDAAPAGEPVVWMREPSTTSRTPVAITHWAKLNHGAKKAGGPGYTAEYTIPLYRAAPAGEP